MSTDEFHLNINIADKYKEDVPLLWHTVQRIKDAKDGWAKERRGFVYIVTDGTAVKIGQTTDLDRRLKSMQTDNPRPLRLLQSIEVYDRDAAEESLHDWFKEYRIRGEWFDLLPLFFGFESYDEDTNWRHNHMCELLETALEEQEKSYA